jgi:hypothetical protein
MFLRLTFFKVKSGKMDELRQLYINVVIPAHKNHSGTAGLMPRPMKKVGTMKSF